MCAQVHERPVRHLQLFTPKRQVGVEGECLIEKRWFVIFVTDRLKQDGDKAPKHRQIGKQRLDSTLNFVILCHFPNAQTAGP